MADAGTGENMTFYGGSPEETKKKGSLTTRQKKEIRINSGAIVNLVTCVPRM